MLFITCNVACNAANGDSDVDDRVSSDDPLLIALGMVTASPLWLASSVTLLYIVVVVWCRHVVPLDIECASILCGICSCTWQLCIWWLMGNFPISASRSTVNSYSSLTLDNQHSLIIYNQCRTTWNTENLYSPDHSKVCPISTSHLVLCQWRIVYTLNK